MKLKFAKPCPQWVKRCVLAVATAGLTACVTINIYFPAAAAEKAADKVIDEIWQTPAGQGSTITPATTSSQTTPKESNVPVMTPAAKPAVIPSANQEFAQ